MFFGCSFPIIVVEKTGVGYLCEGFGGERVGAALVEVEELEFVVLPEVAVEPGGLDMDDLGEASEVCVRGAEEEILDDLEEEGGESVVEDTADESGI